MVYDGRQDFAWEIVEDKGRTIVILRNCFPMV